jgi:hypothetical protein
MTHTGPQFAPIKDLLVPHGSGVGAPPQVRGAVHMQAAVISVGDGLPSLQQVLAGSGGCHSLIPDIIADLYALAQDLGEPPITPAVADSGGENLTAAAQPEQVLVVENYWGFLSARPDRARQQILIAEALAGRKAPALSFTFSRIVADLLTLAQTAGCDPRDVLAQAAAFATE